ncbi:MAG: CBS domain-containing protein [Candidatus Dormibacteraeota bacterium]|nr:CBS domain-containing protein [Candidatus Dormibacteraeota bacterium]
MTQTVNDVMTHKPVALQAGTTLDTAARAMRDHGVGNVIVLNDLEIRGIVTDRDITIRGVAESLDPRSAVLAQICSADVVTVTPEDTVDHAVDVMRAHSVRRLPVVREGRPVGIVSLGDLAVEKDPESVLGQISASEANR